MKLEPGERVVVYQDDDVWDGMVGFDSALPEMYQWYVKLGAMSQVQKGTFMLACAFSEERCRRDCSMTPEERQLLQRFLYSYWFDRPKEDPEIVAEVFAQERVQAVQHYATLIQGFLDSEEPVQSKGDFVRKTLRRYFPSEADAPLRWLEEIGSMLRRGPV